MRPLSPKKNPSRMRVSAMSILEPRPGVFSSASICAVTARSFICYSASVRLSRIKAHFVTDSSKMIGPGFQSV
jgi:hypothetical protein